jgi:hypothetical protein
MTGEMNCVMLKSCHGLYKYRSRHVKAIHTQQIDSTEDGSHLWNYMVS